MSQWIKCPHQCLMDQVFHQCPHGFGAPSVSPTIMCPLQCPHRPGVPIYQVYHQCHHGSGVPFSVLMDPVCPSVSSWIRCPLQPPHGSGVPFSVPMVQVSPSVSPWIRCPLQFPHGSGVPMVQMSPSVYPWIRCPYVPFCPHLQSIPQVFMMYMQQTSS